MSYSYENEKPKVFMEENQELFLAIRDQVREMLDFSGAVKLDHAVGLPKDIGAADSWTMMACIDRLVEIGELREISTEGPAQNRIFVRR